MARRDAPPAGPELTFLVEGAPTPSPSSRAAQRPGWWYAAATVAAAVVAFGAGVAVGSQSRERPSPQAANTPPVVAAEVRSTGRQCSAQESMWLWLGVEVINDGPGTVVLQGLTIELPAGGFNVAGTMWGTCGQLAPLNGIDAPQAPELPEHETTWLSAVLAPRGPCPTPLPVRFRLLYANVATGASAIRVLDGFDDLGQVPYTGCAPPTRAPAVTTT
jgi:hypothetical protein